MRSGLSTRAHNSHKIDRSLFITERRTVSLSRFRDKIMFYLYICLVTYNFKGKVILDMWVRGGLCDIR